MAKSDHFVEEIVAEGLELGRRGLTGRQNQIVKVERRAGTKASLTTNLAGHTNNDLVFTAVEGGDPGEDITIEYADPGADQALSVEVTGTAIKFNLAYATGAVTTTADDIKAALLADAEASALVTAADKPANDGSGLVEDMAPTNLSGGVEGIKVTLRDGSKKLLTVTTTT